MLISHEELRRINDVQIKILEQVNVACKRLNIKYYMVHGSLLGTVKTGKFVPGDDDIDIAFMRKDYEIFIRDAGKYMDSEFFVQSVDTDSEYPLEFSKVRNSNTTYVVEVSKNIRMNHGIYIDVFPIDYCPKGFLKEKVFRTIYKIINLRISNVFEIKDANILKALIRKFTYIIFPSYGFTKKIREKLLKLNPYNDKVCVSGGKPAERCIPGKWFDNAVVMRFEGLDVFVPEAYDEYLTHIYGNYLNRTLVENKVYNEDVIEVNACKIDCEKSYLTYQ